MKKDRVFSNIMFPKEMWLMLKKKAQKEGKSISQLVREGTMYILRSRNLDKQSREEHPFFKVIGMAEAVNDGSLEHDRDIYEE